MPADSQTEPITPEIFARLVDLAALQLAPQEAEYIRQQLNNQLKAVRELEAIPLDTQISVTSHGVPYTPQSTPPIRPDEWTPCPDPQAILAQAPEVDEGYLIVPEIPHTDL